MTVQPCTMIEILAAEIQVPSRSVERWHSHRESQLLFPTHGTMRVDFPGQSWLISPQHALWIPPRMAHQGVYCTDVDLCVLYFREESNGSQPPSGCAWATSASSPRMSMVSPLLREIIIALARNGSYSGPAAAERIDLLKRLLVNEADKCSSTVDAIMLPRNDRLCRLCTQIVDRLTDEWTIDGCARRTAMSRRTFTRTFRADTGMSFREWLRAARLRQAAIKLKSGRSVASVAYDVGYHSPAAFSVCFRSHFGVSPSVF